MSTTTITIPKSKALAYVLWLFLGIVSFLVPLSYAQDGSQYYPLKEGPVWNYQMQGMSLIITNLESRELEGKLVIPQKASAGNFTFFSFAVEDKSGIYEFAEQKPDNEEPQVKKFPSYYFKYPLQTGNSWKESADESDIATTIPMQYSIESLNETVTVPAGTFKKCLKVKKTGTTKLDKGIFGVVTVNKEEISWYAPGVGMIKAMQKRETDNRTVPPKKVIIQLLSYKK
jgi:hypothetical protein